MRTVPVFGAALVCSALGLGCGPGEPPAPPVEPRPAEAAGGLRERVNQTEMPPEPAPPKPSWAARSREQVQLTAVREDAVLGAPSGGPPYATAEGVLGVDGRRYRGTIEDPIPIDVDFLGAWPFEEVDQPFPEHVLAADGKVVRLRGFMLPDVDFEHIKKFHLVRSLWGCCFGAPPRLNEIVRVLVPDSDGIDYTYNTLEVVGTLRCVYESEDGIIADLYRLEGRSITVLGYDDPLAPTDFDPSTGFKGKIPGQ